MEENNNQPKTNVEDNKFKSSKSSVTYSSFEDSGKKRKTNNSGGAGFGKTVLLPFACGILGASLVIGTCFGIPNIKEDLLGYVSESNDSSSVNLNTQQISLLDYSDTAVGVAEKVLPSIVGINVTYSVNSIFYNNQTSASAQGSGVIISEDGYILTNNHVVNSSSSSSYYELGKANKITVSLYNDDTEYEAEIVGTDEQTDLAVIKIDKYCLTSAEIGDSSSVKVGDFFM